MSSTPNFDEAVTTAIDNNSMQESSSPDLSDSEKAVKDASSQPSPPDGGSEAWLVVLGAWCTAFCSFGWLNSIGVFQQYYQKVLLHNENSSTVSWIPSFQIFFILGMVCTCSSVLYFRILLHCHRDQLLAPCSIVMDPDGWFWGAALCTSLVL